jgi:hypothetical protein
MAEWGAPGYLPKPGATATGMPELGGRDGAPCAFPQRARWSGFRFPLGAFVHSVGDRAGMFLWRHDQPCASGAWPGRYLARTPAEPEAGSIVPMDQEPEHRQRLLGRSTKPLTGSAWRTGSG